MILCDDDSQPQERHRNEIIRGMAAKAGIPTPYAKLPCDNVFYGLGPERTPIMIGIEVKRADDMADSVSRSGRLIQQFRACTAYGITQMAVVFQDIVRPSPDDGLMEKWSAGGWTAAQPLIMYGEVDNFLNTLDLKGNVQVKKSSNPVETANIVMNLYRWWQKAPEEHTSMDRFNGAGGAAFLSKDVPLFRKMVKEIPGVGWTRSLDLYQLYVGSGLSILEAFGQTPKEWTKARGVGKVTAEGMFAELHKPL